MTDYGKPAAGFTLLGTSMESANPDLGADETPIDRFFVCTASDAPMIDRDSWRLTITGDAVAHPVELSWDDLMALPQVEQVAWIECAGNGRTMFTLIDGLAVGDPNAVNTGWSLQAMGVARWRGPTLAAVLQAAELTDAAAWVSPCGLDVDNGEGEPARMCLPLDKALDPTTILAVEMNGEPLPRAHGSPVRLLVPGWVGAYSVKWLGELTVSTEWVPSWRADEYYVHRTPDGVKTGTITSHPVKSSLALPFPAVLDAGRHELFGYARSGQGAITSVDWRLDDGDWAPAELDQSTGPLGWTVFRFQVDLGAGDRIVRTRATDGSGAVQPERQPFHPSGVLWQTIIPHQIVAREASSV